MFFVYLIQSTQFPNQRYIGHTENIKARLKTHNSGGSIHTKLYKPWTLKMFLAFQTKSEAIRFEQYLKSGSGRAFAQKRLW